MLESSDPANGSQIVVHVETELQDIIPQFLDNAHADVQSLLIAIGHEDYATIKSLGHSIKGVGGLGFDTMPEIGASIEVAAQAKNMQDIRRLVHQLSGYLDQVFVVFT